MPIKIYNTLTRKKEDFVPIEEGKVRMYVCGPTVYDFLHVGNYRGVIFYNVLRNWLEHRGYKVNYVYNFTDVDDKIINRSLKEGVTAKEISEKYIKEFQKDYATLKLSDFSSNPKVSDHMEDIIEFIKDLESKEAAYALKTDLGTDVYFNVLKFKDYGKLTNKKLDELESGTRAEVVSGKKNEADFALWKAAKPGEPSWDSPWGKGRPGWHIECSCMSQKILGEQIDIHGGGLDLVFPHHENEIAQSEARTGKQFSKYWVHNNMINFGDQKMSKSIGNVVKGRDFINKYNGEILKFLILSSHYRSIVDLSDEQVGRTIKSLSKFYTSFRLAEKIIATSKQPVVNKEFEALLVAHDKKIEAALDDDFNTALVVASFYEVLSSFNAICDKPGKITPDKKYVAESYYQWIKKWGEFLSLLNDDTEELLKSLDEILIREKNIDISKVESLIQQRNKARADKDFELSDKVRDQLNELGVSIHDTASGTTWEVTK